LATLRVELEPVVLETVPVEPELVELEPVELEPDPVVLETVPVEPVELELEVVVEFTLGTTMTTGRGRVPL